MSSTSSAGRRPVWAHTGARRSATGLPSVARFTGSDGASEWFVAIDPEADHTILADGTIGTRPRNLPRGPAALLVAAFATVCGIAWTIYPGDATPGAFLAGAVSGLLLGGLLLLVVNVLLDLASRSTNTKAGVRVSSTVRPGHRRAWRLCEIAVAIANRPVWQDGTVDAERQVPAILWAAVDRAIVVEDRRCDAQRALEHESLGQLAREHLSSIDEESRALDAVEDNLNRVLGTATNIQQRREQIARESEVERRRLAEERELRRRLSGASIGDGRMETDRQADRSAGLAAEASAVDELLADAERMLRDIDRPR